jgi:hypothetical protein
MNQHTTPHIRHAPTFSHAILVKVLQPRPPPSPDLPVTRVALEPGSPEDAVADKAAEIIRVLALRYTVSIDPKRFPAEYQCALADTAAVTADDAVQTAAKTDLVLAGAVQEVFDRAMRGLRIYPTTKRAQVEMQLCAMAAASAIRGLLFKQQGLAL